MNSESPPSAPQVVKKGLSWSQLVLTVVLTVLITAGLTYWALTHYLFLKEFEPVQLKPHEQQLLNSKLRAIGLDVQEQQTGETQATLPPLEPEPYSEQGAKREVHFSERELNAMLAKNTDLSRKLAIDLSDDLVSAILLVPMEQDFPVLGGKTLRLHAGVEFAYVNQQPVVILKGISLMGVPIPNAWLGNLKNVDLVNEFGSEEGFWKSFSEGVEDVHVEEGKLLIKLKE